MGVPEVMLGTSEPVGLGLGAGEVGSGMAVDVSGHTMEQEDMSWPSLAALEESTSVESSRKSSEVFVAVVCCMFVTGTCEAATVCKEVITSRISRYLILPSLLTFCLFLQNKILPANICFRIAAPLS